MSHNAAAITEFMIELFLFNPDDLEGLCRYETKLKYVLIEFRSHWNLKEKVECLIEYCATQNMMPHLLQALAQKYPAPYADYQQKITAPPPLTPAEIRKILEKQLFHLDWHEHRDTFKQLLANFDYGARAFLIHGPSACGQIPLSYHLMEQAQIGRYWDTRKIPIHLTRNGKLPHEIYFKRLWNEVNYRIHETRSPSQTTHEAIMAGLAQLLQTHDVFIIINDLANLEPTDWAMLLKEFWQPIVDKVDQTMQDAGSRLFLLLVDLEEKCHNWQDCLEPTQPHFHPHYPIRLPKNDHFSQADLTRWLNNTPRLKPYFKPETLYDKTYKGLPDEVYYALCEVFDVSPEEIFPQGAF